MIAYIKGTLEKENIDSIWVETSGGVAYEIFVPVNLLEYLPPVGSQVKIYTYLNVKEDLMQLYGFLDTDELDIFKLLITVSGIGPKGALGILGALSADDIRFAILSGDVKTISKAPGIGTKTAGRVVLELKDKMNLQDAFAKKLEHESSSQANTAVSSDSQIKKDAIEALEALGYTPTESLQAVKKVSVTDGMSAEDVLKAALKELI